MCSPTTAGKWVLWHWAASPLDTEPRTLGGPGGVGSRRGRDCVVAGAWVARPRGCSGFNPVENGARGVQGNGKKRAVCKGEMFLLLLFYLCNNSFRSVLWLVIFEIYYTPSLKFDSTAFPGVRRLSLSSTRFFFHLDLPQSDSPPWNCLAPSLFPEEIRQPTKPRNFHLGRCQGETPVSEPSSLLMEKAQGLL